MKTAKIMRITINPEVLFHAFGINSAWMVEKGIPEGATLRGFNLDANTQNLIMFIEHPSFEEVQLESELAPQLEMLFRKINKNEFS